MRIQRFLAMAMPLVLSAILSIASIVGLSGSVPTPFPPMAPVPSPSEPSTLVTAPAPTSSLPASTPKVETRQVRLSHYWPPYLGTNCGRIGQAGADSTYCVARTASGERWEDWIGRGAACPPEFPFGTVIMLPGGERFTCIDRGGKIKTVDGVPWIDLLVFRPPVPYGTLVEVRVIYP